MALALVAVGELSVMYDSLRAVIFSVTNLFYQVNYNKLAM